MRRTKIVATIGPASDSVHTIGELIDAGLDVFRFNLKHNTTDWHSERLERVETVCQEKQVRVATLLDLQGPEVRIHTVPGGRVRLKPGELVRVSVPGEEGVTLDHPEVFSYLTEGQTVYADDGFLEFRVGKVGKRFADLVVVQGGVLRERKTINFPGAHLSFPTLVERDLERLTLASRYHVDFVALSFVRRVADIRLLKRELKKLAIESKVIAKIEHPDAIASFDAILREADGVMVARGDLGIEYPMEEVPALQKMIVKRCREEGKPVIIATQMLESMIEHPRPTRAEVSDVANAAYEAADAVMLSGETATGTYPVRAVEMMAKIVTKVDETNDAPKVVVDWKLGGQTAAVVSAAKMLMEYGYRGVCDLEAFVVLSETGRTVEYLSRLRPELPIFALTHNQKTLDQLKLSWGVTPVYYDYSKEKKLDERKVVQMLLAQGMVTRGKNVVMVYGEALGKPGLTSVIRVQHV